MKEREVIVVGAGPSGATAAMALAQMGRDVLLLDRQEFPRDKACGDGIPSGAVELLYGLGMKDKILSADFYPINRIRLVSPGGHIFDANFTENPVGAEAYVVPRLIFDAVLQEHAVASGAEFCKGQVKEPIVENGRTVGVRATINGKLQEIRSKVVVAADGVTSAITRALRPVKHEDLHRAVALRAYIEDLEELPHRVEFYLSRDILPGYAWIFPMGEGRANIGLGMRLDVFRSRKADLEALLGIFMAMPTIKKRLKRGGKLRDISIWQLNFGSQRKLQHAYDGALLTGDAAGFINPLTGGGIHNALISAQFAADVIHNSLSQGDVSRKAFLAYEKLVHEVMWSGMRRSYFIQRWLLRFPTLVDFVVGRMTSDSEFAQTFMAKL